MSDVSKTLTDGDLMRLESQLVTNTIDDNLFKKMVDEIRAYPLGDKILDKIQKLKTCDDFNDLQARRMVGLVREIISAREYKFCKQKVDSIENWVQQQPDTNKQLWQNLIK